MTKKEQQRYDKMIDGVADDIVFSAYKQALRITDDVYLDILLRMRTKVDERIRRIQENKRNENKAV